MPAYHSKFPDAGTKGDVRKACGCALFPLKTASRGPGFLTPAPEGEDDILDEALFFFRANVLFRNFEVRSAADRTLILITLYIQLVLKEAEKHDTKAEGAKHATVTALKAFSIPGDPGFSLGSIFTPPANREEADTFRAYYKMVREETVRRVIEKLYNADGTKNKWWQSFSKRKFMNKELKQ